MALTTRAWESLVGAEGRRVRAVRAGAWGEFGRLERKLRDAAGTPFLKIGVAGHGETNNQG